MTNLGTVLLVLNQQIMWLMCEKWLMWVVTNSRVDLYTIYYEYTYTLIRLFNSSITILLYKTKWIFKDTLLALIQEFDWLMKLNPESLTENPVSLNPTGHKPEMYYANFEIVHVPSFRCVCTILSTVLILLHLNYLICWIWYC